MENKYVVAVDLGTTKVVVAVGRKVEKNKVEIVAIKHSESKGVIKGDLRNNMEAFQALSKVKTEIEAELGVTIKDVYIGISGQHIKCTKATGYVFVHNSEMDVTEVSDDDVKRLENDMYNSALPPGQSIISVLPQTYKIDDEPDIIEPVGMEGKRLEAQFNLIVGDNGAIDRIKRCFSRAGMEVKGITLQPLASSFAVLSEDEKELGVAVVDIGGGTTDVCIYHDKIIRHIGVLPIGGNEINKDIKSHGILDRHLEKLKTMFGEAVAELAPDQKYVTIPSISGQAPKEISVRTLSGIIQARMCDIVEFVAAEIKRSGYEGRLGAGVVITGGGAVLKNVERLFKKMLGCEVRIAQPTQHLTPESVEKMNSPKFSTIAGLLIDAAKKNQFSTIVGAELLGVVAEQPEEVVDPEAKRLAMMEAQRQKYEANHTETEDSVRPISGEEEPAPEPVDPPEVDDPIYPEEEEDDLKYAKPRKKGFFKRMGGVFGKMFEPDEVDAEDNY
ncbi:MAG: cell division protein FtsA [Rikenellaceae bacterium]